MISQYRHLQQFESHLTRNAYALKNVRGLSITRSLTLSSSTSVTSNPPLPQTCSHQTNLLHINSSPQHKKSDVQYQYEPILQSIDFTFIPNPKTNKLLQRQRLQIYLQAGFGSLESSSNGYKHLNLHQCTHTRCFHLSSTDFVEDKDKDKPEKPPSSKVEETINTIKQQEKEQQLVPVPKRSIWKRIEDEILHYYHGFRLLFLDTKICVALVWRLIRGNSLSRREHRQLIRTSSDLFRLVPFSVFIIVPFMELLLPVFLKFFPGMLPSTFQTKNERETKMKAQFKVKLEMAKFLQETLDEMGLKAKGHSSENAKSFAQFIQKIRSSGEEVSNEEIIKFSKLFEDEITLDSLSRNQLIALCRVVEINHIGTNALLRLTLRMKLKSLVADDKTIEEEGIESLNYQELQLACKSRGMRAVGVPEDRLRRQLAQWINLSLHEKIPPSLLLLSRAMYLPEDLPASSQLQATLSALPEAAALHVKSDIGEREGKLDHKTRIEVIIGEQKAIREERNEELTTATKAKEVVEKEEEKALETEKEIEPEAVPEAILEKEPIPSTPSPAKEKPPKEKPAKEKPKPEPAPISSELYMDTVADMVERCLSRHVPHPLADAYKEPVTKDDFVKIETALEHLTAEGKYGKELKELRTEVTEYEEDVENLTKLKSTTTKQVDVKETKAAKLLHAKVNKMISMMSQAVQSLGPDSEDPKRQVVKVEDVIDAIQRFQNVSDPARLERIVDVLESLDFDKDGQIEVEHVIRVLELIGKENVKVSPQLVQEIVDMIRKDEEKEKE